MQSNYRRNLLDVSRTPANATDVATTLKAFDLQPIDNDGVYTYLDNKQEPKTTNNTYTPDQECEIFLTDAAVDITEFNNSFIRLDIQQTLTFDAQTLQEIRNAFPRLYKNNAVATDSESDGHELIFERMLADNQYIFVGYKMSSQAISTYGFRSNGMMIQQATQNEGVTEQYLYGIYKSKDEISNKKHVFSPYNEVATFDNSICGTWVPLSKILNPSEPCTITIPLVIPYTTLLCLQSFEQFPNFLFGSLTFLFKCSPIGEVWTQVNPIESISKHVATGVIDATRYPELTSVLACAKETWGYTRAFQQVGLLNNVCFCTGTALTGTDTNTTKFGGALQFFAGALAPCSIGFKITNITTFTKGYKIRNDIKDSLSQYFLSNEFGGDNHVFTLCGQRIDNVQLGSGHGAPNSFVTQESVQFNRTTSIHLLMPLSDAQRTVFFNPCLASAQFFIGNISYPRQEVSTISPEFFEMMMMGSDFDALFAANDDIEHSYTDYRIGVDENGGYKFIQPYTNDTDWVWSISLEREDSSQANFDGIHDTFPVRVKGSPAFPGCNIYSLQNKDLNASGKPPPTPTLCMCQDTFWIFRRIKGADGRLKVNVQYIRNADYRDAVANRTVEGVESELNAWAPY